MRVLPFLFLSIAAHWYNPKVVMFGWFVIVPQVKPRASPFIGWEGSAWNRFTTPVHTVSYAGAVFPGSCTSSSGIYTTTTTTTIIIIIIMIIISPVSLSLTCKLLFKNAFLPLGKTDDDMGENDLLQWATWGGVISPLLSSRSGSSTEGRLHLKCHVNYYVNCHVIVMKVAS